MSSKNIKSVRRLCDYIKDNIYTTEHIWYNQVIRCTGYTIEDGNILYADDKDSPNYNKLICTFKVELSEAKFDELDELITDKHGNKVHKRDLKHYKIIPGTTKKYSLDILLPKDDFGVITSEDSGISRTSINSGYYKPAIKYFRNTIKLEAASNGGKFNPSMWIKINDKQNFPLEILKIYNYELGYNFELPLKAVLNYYGLLKKSNYGIENGYAEFLKVDVPENEMTLTDEQINALKSFKINPNAFAKLKIVSKGEFNPPNNMFTGDVLDFILSRYYVDIENHEFLYQNHLERYCDRYNLECPLDFKFMDALDAVVVDLEEERHKLTGDMYYMYNRKNRAGERAEIFSATKLQNAINKYFKGQTDNFHDIQVTTDSNALTMLSQKNTLYLYREGEKTGSDPDTDDFVKMSVFNKSFMGVIEPCKTPETGSLVNVKSELSLDVEIDESGEVLIKVINLKTGEYEKIPYTQFCSEPILSADCYDEETGKVIKSQATGKYDITQYWDYMHLDELPENLKYARDKTCALTYSTAMIPNPNRMVSGRTSLAARFLDQSIPVVGAKPPAVYTRMGKEVYKNNSLNVIYDLKEPATVVDISGADQSFVKVKTASGKIKVFKPKCGEAFSKTSNSTTNVYRSQFKIGQKVKPGDVIITSNSFVDGEFTTQVPLYVMFGTYKGMEHEDGIILTESAAAKFSHVSYMTRSEDFSGKYWYAFKRNDYNDAADKYSKVEPISLNGKKNKALAGKINPSLEKLKEMDHRSRKYNLNEWSLAIPGTVVQAGTILFEYYTYDNDSIYSALYTKFRPLTESTEQLHKLNSQLPRTLHQIRVPYDVRGTGVITKVSLKIKDDSKLFDEGTLLSSSLEKDNLERVDKGEMKMPGCFGINSLDTDNKTAYKFFKDLFEEEQSEKLHWEGKRKGNSDVWKLSDDDNVMELRIEIRYLNILSSDRLGAKLTNFYASKGVNVHIIPDKYAPRDDFGNIIEAVIGLGTTFSRQNPGQYDECKLGLIALETWKLIKDRDAPTEKIKKFLDKLYPPIRGKRSWDWNKLKLDGQNYGYCRIPLDYNDKYYRHELILELLGPNGLNLGDGTTYIYYPEFGKNIRSETKCTVGLTSMNRLHFIQEHKAKVTPSGKIGFDDNDNIDYIDLEKSGGQKMGQMEMHAALAQGVGDVIGSIAVQEGRESKGAYISSKLIGLGLLLR